MEKSSTALSACVGMLYIQLKKNKTIFMKERLIDANEFSITKPEFRTTQEIRVQFL